MGFFYFDESVHSKENFALGAFAYSESSLDQPVAEALRQSGLRPYMDEFKSGSLMVKHPEQAHARGQLLSVVREHCRIGIVVALASPLDTLGQEGLQGLEKIVSTNSFGSTNHEVFFDQGIFSSRVDRASPGKCSAQNCQFNFEQDSVKVLGLQVADLIAHTCATILRAQLGSVKKTVKAWTATDDDPDVDMPLEFELWAGLRFNFFATAPASYETWKSQLDFKGDVASRGLHISDLCDESVKNAALARFGSVYLGCIH